jgi:two-component system LytT family sensor kinase
MPVRPPRRGVHNNPFRQNGACLTFVIMHRTWFKYFVEIVIHALFWLGVYNVLGALTASSYSMLIDHGNGSMEHVDVSFLFPYTGLVLGMLMLLFYSNTWWLFKRVIRYKSDLPRVLVIAGWFSLIFATNYLLVRTLIGPSPHPQHPKSFEVIRSSSDSFRARPPKAKVYFESRSDTTLLGTTTTISPFSPPPPPPPIQRSGADDWSHMQLVIALVFLSVLAVAAANFFIKERIRNDLTRSQAEAQHLQTEIRLLRSQVNPHFLFNTLNNLFSMAQRKGNDQLADSISKLSGMMRYMIYESDTDAVPLQREISYLDDCIALNKLRYADSEIAVSFSHPAPAIAAAISIAPMLFVPFLENAFKHGVSIGSQTRIDMDISVEQKKLIFTCENIDYSGVKKLEEEKGGIGLENVRRRLELLYPGRHELRAGAAQGKYTVNLQIELA